MQDSASVTASHKPMTERRRYRTWTPDDTATLWRMAQAGYSDAEIAAHMGRDRDVIGRKRRALQIRPGISPALTMMMARINARRFRLQNQSRSLA